MVVWFLARILLGADRVVPEDLWVGLTAALFHDSGLASAPGKIVESEIAAKAEKLGVDHPDVKKFVQSAIDSRLKHADFSVPEFRSVTEKHAEKLPLPFTVAQDAAIERLLKRHDHLKVGTLQVQLGLEVVPQYVYGLDAPSLFWDHFVADLSWMLEEIETDRLRDQRRGREPKTPLDQLDWNLKCHRDILLVYEKVFPNELDEFGFLNGLPIRSHHVLNLYLELEREVRGRYTE